MSPSPARRSGPLAGGAAAKASIGGDFYEVVDTKYVVRLLIGDVRGKDGTIRFAEAEVGSLGRCEDEPRWSPPAYPRRSAQSSGTRPAGPGVG